MPWLSGKDLAQTVRDGLKARLIQEGLRPRLAVLLVGNDPASMLYVGLKQRAAAEVGIDMILRRETELEAGDALTIIEAWNADPKIHGILVQLPLPAGMDTDAVIRAIDPAKDVDAFHPDNRAALLRGEARVFSPVHLAVLRLIAETPLRLNGTATLLLAKSPVFSEPLAHLLRKAGAPVTIASAPPAEMAAFPLVITALGQAGALRGDGDAELVEGVPQRLGRA